MTESHIIQKNQPCPECGSSDAAQVYSDGHAFCYSCSTNFPNWEEANEKSVEEVRNDKASEVFSVVDVKSKVSLEAINSYPSKGSRERQIDRRVFEHFGVKCRTNASGEVDAHFYPYTSSKGDTIAYKSRVLPKDFASLGIIGDFKESVLFAQSLFGEGGKRVVVTEGELDAMSYAQACLSKKNIIYPVVSLPSASGTKALEKSRDWLRSFDEVVLWIDNDDAGEKALKKAAKIIGYDKVKVVKSVDKDASDTLVNQGVDAVYNAVWNAKDYSPAGIITDPEVIWQQLLEYNKIESVPYPACLEGLNEKCKGMRMGEISLFTSGTGSGKSTMLREIMIHLLENTEEKIGIVSLEEAPSEVARKLAGMAINMNPAKEEIPEDKLRPGFDKVFGSGRVIVLDHQGAINDGSIIDTLEAMCVMGAKYLFVDHITILVSEGADGLTGNEATDKVMNDLLSLVKRHNVWVGLVSHLRKMTTVGQSFEDGKLASLDDIRGSGSIKQISFDILAFARDLNAETEDERNTVKMAVLKSRYTGLTGPCGNVKYNYDTGRLCYAGFDVSEDGTAGGIFDIDI